MNELFRGCPILPEPSTTPSTEASIPSSMVKKKNQKKKKKKRKKKKIVTITTVFSIIVIHTTSILIKMLPFGVSGNDS